MTQDVLEPMRLKLTSSVVRIKRFHWSWELRMNDRVIDNGVAWTGSGARAMVAAIEREFVGAVVGVKPPVSSLKTCTFWLAWCAGFLGLDLATNDGWGWIVFWVILTLNWGWAFDRAWRWRQALRGHAYREPQH